MRRWRLKILLFILMACFTACENTDDASDVAIFISGDLRKNVTSGEILNIRVNASTPNDFISEFMIYSKDNERGQASIYSCFPGTKTYSYDFVYTVPVFSKNGSELTLVFEGKDNFGNSNMNAFSMTVESAALKESSFMEMFNPKSDEDDGLNVATKQPVRYATLSQSDMPDCFWLYADDVVPERMTREFRTSNEGTNVSFAKSNTFDYANATGTMLRAAFEASVKQNYVTGIQAGDIILLGYNGVGAAVMKIIEIHDEDGYMNDFILYSIKY